jgi:ferredoxin
MTALPPPSKKKLGLVIDLDTCVGCHACATSCKEWNAGGIAGPLTDERPYGKDPQGVWFNRVHSYELEADAATKQPAQTLHFPRSCLHCETPACVTVCPTGASYKRAEDGIVLWQARELGIPLHFPPAHPFNPLPALRLCLAAPDRMRAIDAIFAHLWERGLQGDSIDALADVARSLGIADPATAIARGEVKRELLANGEEAMALGGFGVPMLRVRDELFWGNDATGLALAYARDPAVLDAEMRRVDALPEAIQRKRSA